MLENSGISAMQKTTRRKEIEIKRKRHGEGEKEKEMVTSPATPLTSIACRKHKWGTSVEVGEIAVYIFFSGIRHLSHNLRKSNVQRELRVSLQGHI